MKDSTGKISTVCICPGLYRIVGATCECGGELRVQDFGHQGWEMFCRKCFICAANGEDCLTLRETIEYTGHFSNEGAAK